VLAAAGAFAVVTVMLIGGLVALYLFDPAVSSLDRQAKQAAQYELPVEARGAVSRHIKAGLRHYDEGHYVKAFSQFDAAHKLVPSYPEAKRLKVLATEELMLSTLEDGLILRNAPDREKKSMRAQALRLGRQVLAGRGDHSKALKALRDVLVFSPDDKRVQALLKKLNP